MYTMSMPLIRGSLRHEVFIYEGLFWRGIKDQLRISQVASGSNNGKCLPCRPYSNGMEYFILI